LKDVVGLKESDADLIVTDSGDFGFASGSPIGRFRTRIDEHAGTGSAPRLLHKLDPENQETTSDASRMLGVLGVDSPPARNRPRAR